MSLNTIPPETQESNSSITVFDIEIKEDSAERLAAVQEIDTKFILFAPEFNAVVNKVKEIASTAKIIPFEQLLVFKASLNLDNTTIEVGDYCMGFVEQEFINANYLGGDVTLKASFDI